MQAVKKGDTVKVHYHGTLSNGETFDTSEGREPLEFTVGTGAVIPGFDAGVLDMHPGDKKTIQIPVEEAYGARKEELVVKFPADRLPQDLKPEVGMQLQLSNEDGQTFPVTVTEVGDDTILLDANHPLAGEDLTFALELVEIS